MRQGQRPLWVPHPSMRGELPTPRRAAAAAARGTSAALRWTRDRLRDADSAYVRAVWWGRRTQHV